MKKEKGFTASEELLKRNVTMAEVNRQLKSTSDEGISHNSLAPMLSFKSK